MRKILAAAAMSLIAMAYVVQVQAAAWYVRFTDQFFGAPVAATPQPLPR